MCNENKCIHHTIYNAGGDREVIIRVLVFFAALTLLVSLGIFISNRSHNTVNASEKGSIPELYTDV